jgi:hypothetical protein
MKTDQTDFSDLQLYIGIDAHKKQWNTSFAQAHYVFILDKPARLF